MLSSPAIRAFSTALIFANKLSFSPEKIQLKNAIYEATVQNLLRVLQENLVEEGTYMLFGHNPGLTDLINYLCGPILVNLPTAAVVHIQLNNDLAGRWVQGSAVILQQYSGHKSF